MFTESFLDSAVVQVSYFLREHYVHSTGKEIKLRSSSHPQRTFRHIGVGVSEGVTETLVKVEQNKGAVWVHMLENKKRKGPLLVRDFINKVMFKMPLECSS